MTESNIYFLYLIKHIIYFKRINLIFKCYISLKYYDIY